MVRRSLWVGALLALSVMGCRSGEATDASKVGKLDDENIDRRSLPPLTLSASLPPLPVPATFDVADLAERVQPTVVNITTSQHVELPEGHPFEFFFGPDSPSPPGERTGAGTGFIIDPNGYVVTNEHVVHDADTVSVKLADEREFAAEVVGRDEKLDLALLKLAGASNLPTAALGSSEALRIGESVLAVGNPFGLGHTVTLGIVSAKSRTIGAGPYDDFIQTDASINPGNSGGPLFNWRGEVVGINTAIRPGANSIGFAIPIDALKNVLSQLRETGHVTRGKLGLVFQPISKELAQALKLDSTHGALIAQVEPGGSAARAGLKAGDVILSVNGIEILHAEELPRNVARNGPGAEIKVVYLRNGVKAETKAKLDELEDESVARPKPPTPGADPSSGQLGVQVSDAKPSGVRIDGIMPTSPLKEFRPGDIIVEVDEKPIKNIDALEKLLSASTPGTVLLAKVVRGDSTRYAPLPVPEKASKEPAKK
ncbi:MAG: Do family serine endopeptidase [Polyangiaceae bacterium]